MSEEKRVRRTAEQIAADLDQQVEELQNTILEIEEKKETAAAAFDEKIAGVNLKIQKLQTKKKAVLTPKKRKPRKTKTMQIKALIKQAQKSGLQVKDIAEKLGVTLEEE